MPRGMSRPGMNRSPPRKASRITDGRACALEMPCFAEGRADEPMRQEEHHACIRPDIEICPDSAHQVSSRCSLSLSQTSPGMGIGVRVS